MGRFDFIDEPTQVLAEAADFLAGEPVLTTVLATVTARAAADDAAGVPREAKAPRWWCLARDSVGAVVGMAMRTTLGAPYPIYVIGLVIALPSSLGSCSRAWTNRRSAR